jgi:hypothetical protein
LRSLSAGLSAVAESHLECYGTHVHFAFVHGHSMLSPVPICVPWNDGMNSAPIAF